MLFLTLTFVEGAGITNNSSLTPRFCHNANDMQSRISHLFRLLIAAALLAAAFSLVYAAPDPERVALVIGNSAYPGAGALKNPVNDAKDMAAKLGRYGFHVTLKTDVGHKDMLRALTEFGDKVQQGSEALFFYAGHGMQVRGKNYLIPIDAQIRTETAVSSEAVDVDQLLDKLSPARLSMVILDACRNNPFERRFRGGGHGLASINAPTGTLIAYATAPGKVAADGDGRNGLYTQELLTAMDMSGMKVEDVFKRVRSNVVRKSGDAQTPWESSSLTGDFYFTSQPFPLSGNDQNRVEDEIWNSIKDSRATEPIQEYLRQYPNGRFLPQAKILIAKITSENRLATPQASATGYLASSRTGESNAPSTSDGLPGDTPFARFSRGEIIQNCELTCSFSWGNARTQLKNLHDAGHWKELADLVISIGYLKDLPYYYLGRSAEGLGYTNAARQYYAMAKGSKRCDGILNTCSGFEFPKDIDERLKVMREMPINPQAMTP